MKSTPIRLRTRNTFAPNSGNCRDNGFSESPLFGEYFGKLNATGEWGVCLLSTCKVRYPKNKIIIKSSKVKILSFDIKHIMFFGVTVQEVD